MADLVGDCLHGGCARSQLQIDAERALPHRHRDEAVGMTQAGLQRAVGKARATEGDRAGITFQYARQHQSMQGIRQREIVTVGRPVLASCALALRVIQQQNRIAEPGTPGREVEEQRQHSAANIAAPCRAVCSGHGAQPTLGSVEHTWQARCCEVSHCLRRTTWRHIRARLRDPAGLFGSGGQRRHLGFRLRDGRSRRP